MSVVLVEEEEGGAGTARISDHNRLQKNLSTPTPPPPPWGVLESKQAEGEFPHLQGPSLCEPP